MAAQYDGWRISRRDNIIKARRAFYAECNWCISGELNPLSSSSVFETWVLHILLCRCETWILNQSTLSSIESLRVEIGQKILKLPSFSSNWTIYLFLWWSSMVSRILVWKRHFLAKLLQPGTHSISSHIFTTAAITNSWNMSIVQQCRMLERITETSLLQLCLENPEAAVSIKKQTSTNITITV